MLLGLPDIVQGGMESRERGGRQERERGRGRGERRKKALCGGPDRSFVNEVSCRAV